MSALDYLIIGHVTQDREEQRFALGGTATYSAITARNLGQRVGLLTSAAFEPGLVDILTMVQVARIPAEHTTRFVNIYEKDQRIQYVEARAETLEADQVLPEWRDAPLVHLAPVADEISADLVDAFPNALVGVTPQGWMRTWDESGLVRAIPWKDAEHVLQRADAVILSDQDVPEEGLLEQYAAQARLLVVTRGDRGASVYRDGEARHLAAFQPKRVSDPTGAGDVFATAFLLHLRDSGDPFLSAEFANCVASFAVEKKHYAGIPTLEQVQERWRTGKRRRQVGPK